MGQEFDDLFAFNRPLQNGFPGFEFARLLVRLRFLAKKFRLALKHARAAARALTQGLLAGEIEFWRRLPGFVRFGGARFRPAFARLELETHFAAFADHEVSRERPALFGNELRQQAGPAARKQLGHLRALHRLLQNNFTGAKVAGLRRAG